MLPIVIAGLPIDYFTGVLAYLYTTELHQTVGYYVAAGDAVTFEAPG